MDQAQAVPYNQLGNVLKLFDLNPLPMGVMFTGITSIGTRTIGKMVSEFGISSYGLMVVNHAGSPGIRGSRVCLPMTVGVSNR